MCSEEQSEGERTHSLPGGKASTQGYDDCGHVSGYTRRFTSHLLTKILSANRRPELAAKKLPGRGRARLRRWPLGPALGCHSMNCNGKRTDHCWSLSL